MCIWHTCIARRWSDQVSQILKQRKAQHHCLACQTACSPAFQKIHPNYLSLQDHHFCLFCRMLNAPNDGFLWDVSRLHTAEPVQDNEDCISRRKKPEGHFFCSLSDVAQDQGTSTALNVSTCFNLPIWDPGIKFYAPSGWSSTNGTVGSFEASWTLETSALYTFYSRERDRKGINICQVLEKITSVAVPTAWLTSSGFFRAL